MNKKENTGTGEWVVSIQMRQPGNRISLETFVFPSEEDAKGFRKDAFDMGALAVSVAIPYKPEPYASN